MIVVQKIAFNFILCHRNVNCADLFRLPAHMILDYASLLLSAAAVDREEKKVIAHIVRTL